MQNKDIRQPVLVAAATAASCGLMQNKDIRQQDGNKTQQGRVVV